MAVSLCQSREDEHRLRTFVQEKVSVTRFDSLVKPLIISLIVGGAVE